MKGIVIYYSYTGNTKYVAELIANNKNFDIEELKIAKTYPNNYDELVNIEEEKMGEKEYIPLKNKDIDLTKYDIVILLSPVWWYHIHGSLRTFLRDYNLDGKNVYAIATNGGWVGHAKEDFLEYVDLKDFLDVSFSGNKCNLKDSEILDFIK